MANYIGLQGIFNALAGGGANAVNIYAQEKDRQRRLAFDEQKFAADQAYRKNVLDHDRRRLDLAARRMDHTEAVYRDQEEAARRRELIERQTKLAGYAGTLAGQRGYNDRFSFLMSDDPDGHLMLEASIGNLASKERKTDTQVKLVEAGVNEQGEKLYQTTFMGKKGKVQNFGPASTKAQLAGQVRAMNVSYGIIDHLAADGVGVQTKPDGQKVLVNDKGKTPELDAEQQQVVAQLEDVAQQSMGTGLQDVLDNPPERAVQEALAQEDVEVDAEPDAGQGATVIQPQTGGSEAPVSQPQNSSPLSFLITTVRTS